MHKNRGFIKVILLIVIALVVLGLLGYRLEDVINAPAVKDNLQVVWDVFLKAWDAFIVTPVEWLIDKLKDLKR